MQTTVSYMKDLPQFAGVLDGLFHDIETGKNDAGTAVQVQTVTITPVDATTYTITLNGLAIAVVSASSGATAASIRDQLVAAIRARSELDGILSAFPFSATALRITALVAGTGFTISVGANLSNANTQANGTPEAIPFGRGVVRRTAGGDQSVTLPSADSDEFIGVCARVHSNVDPANSNANSAMPFSDLSIVKRGMVWVEVDTAVTDGQNAYLRFATGGDAGAVGTFRPNKGGTAQVDRIAVGGATNSSSYQVAIEGLVAIYVSDASATVDEICQGLADAINFLVAEHGLLLAAAADLANDRVDITSTDPGNAFVTSIVANPGTNLTLSQVTANAGDRAKRIRGRFKSTTTGAGLARLALYLEE